MMSIQAEPGLGMAIPTVGNLVDFSIEAFLVAKLYSAVYVGGWVNSLRMRGGTSKSYTLSVMLCDFIIYVIFTQGFYIANVIYGVD